jgi:hypothetical protein
MPWEEKKGIKDAEQQAETEKALGGERPCFFVLSVG